MSQGVDVGSALVSVRGADGGADEDRDWSAVSSAQLAAAVPWRTFRWVTGQKHYSGSFWAATAGDHVIYESRLESARLLYADFDPTVTSIVAQPFLLKACVGGKQRRHVPDFFLCGGAVPLVVDVKPRSRLADPLVAATLEWTRSVVEARGWDYEVWCEPLPVELENVRFLAGYRRGWLFDDGLVAQIEQADLEGVRLGEALGRFGRPAQVVKPALLHLLWRQAFTVDLDTPLSAGHLLRRSL